MVKTYILDTNVLLHDPKAIFSFKDSEILIPVVVIEELDKKKSSDGEVGKNARDVIRTLEELRKSGNISKGIKKDNCVIKIDVSVNKVPENLDLTYADNKIIAFVLGLKKSKLSNTTLITRDINLRIKAESFGIKSEDYAQISSNKTEDIYNGFKEILVDSDFINEFNAEGKIVVPSNEFFENQYVLMKSKLNTKHSSLARFEKGKLVKLNIPSDVWGIKPRNKEQSCAFDAMLNDNIKLVSIIGKAGGGKTVCTLAATITQVFDKHKYKKLVIAKPTIPLGKQHEIGFLPGSLREKLDPYLGSVWDNLEFLFGDKGKVVIETYIDRGQIELCSLQHIRGRNFRDSLILIEEAQQLSKHDVKTILTRCSEGTKIIISGDVEQIDNLSVDSLTNGMSYVIEKFKEYDLSAHITFTKGERSRLATISSEIL